ncbi:Retrotransposon Gag-like protein 6 [Anabarilius grahami]|uniref:Retrotransposon Gag-like protein 6 n=1 Tax=Anabarilius grahami TaxID=495550 RepID=A0A3N0XPI2_ANAGA|nr:Retrotransposon Gag-like protein 6 [Anabarilius grahami]
MSQQDPFQALVDALRRTFTVNPPPPPVITSPSPTPAIPTVSTVPSPSSPVFTSPMARPAPYSGSVEDCSGFLLQCELVLEMQPHLYPTETAKIAFLISQLTGKALKWADSIWSQHGEVTQSYSAFISHFQEILTLMLTSKDSLNSSYLSPVFPVLPVCSSSVCVCPVTSSDLQLQRLYKDHSSENGKDSNYLQYPLSSASIPSLHLHTSYQLSWFK